MLVEVTQEDIDHGVEGNCHLCPIALAVGRLMLGDNRVVVNSIIKVYEYKLGWLVTEYEMPLEARDFIEKFDSGRPVSPFSFELVEVK